MTWVKSQLHDSKLLTRKNESKQTSGMKYGSWKAGRVVTKYANCTIYIEICVHRFLQWKPERSCILVVFGAKVLHSRQYVYLLVINNTYSAPSCQFQSVVFIPFLNPIWHDQFFYPLLTEYDKDVCADVGEGSSHNVCRFMTAVVDNRCESLLTLSTSKTHLKFKLWLDTLETIGFVYVYVNTHTNVNLVLL